MTRLGHSFLYRADWTWQRSEEALLALRYYWWCVQAAMLIWLSLYRRYGLMVAVNGASVSARHTGCHGWDTTPGEPVSAVTLILGLRKEAKERERAMFLTVFDGPPRPDPIPGTRLTPLDDRDPYYFSEPAVEGTIVVVDGLSARFRQVVEEINNADQGYDCLGGRVHAICG